LPQRATRPVSDAAIAVMFASKQVFHEISPHLWAGIS
jgi:hypothetical protein